jgi:hypothetical protein
MVILVRRVERFGYWGWWIYRAIKDSERCIFACAFGIVLRRSLGGAVPPVES